MEENKLSAEECTLTDQELMDKCREWVSRLCQSGGKDWTLQVPVNFNADPDMLFSELIKRYAASRLPQPSLNQQEIEQTAEGVLEKMRVEMPFHFSENIKPYVKEAMVIMYRAALQSKSTPVEDIDDEVVREEIYQHLNTLCISASTAHGLTLHLFKNYNISRK